MWREMQRGMWRGRWEKDVDGAVEKNVEGDVEGGAEGDVEGDGDVEWLVERHAEGDVEAVDGVVEGHAEGDAKRCVEGDVVEGAVEGAVEENMGEGDDSARQKEHPASVAPEKNEIHTCLTSARCDVSAPQIMDDDRRSNVSTRRPADARCAAMPTVLCSPPPNGAQGCTVTTVISRWCSGLAQQCTVRAPDGVSTECSEGRSSMGPVSRPHYKIKARGGLAAGRQNVCVSRHGQHWKPLLV